MQRYKKGSRSVACVVAVRSSWQAKGNNTNGLESEGVPLWGAFLFFRVPNYWDTSAQRKPQRVRFQPLDVKVFLKKNSKTFYK